MQRTLRGRDRLSYSSHQPSRLTRSLRSFVVASSSPEEPQSSQAPQPPTPKAVSGLFKRVLNSLSLLQHELTLLPTCRSLQDFGIGAKGLTEGGSGLFLLAGLVASIALVNWARGNAMRTGTTYQMTIELPMACGITIGTPVRIRGVQVGQVLNVKPSLERVDVLCEVRAQPGRQF